MLTIYRYGLRFADAQEVEMPAGAHVLSVGVKQGDGEISLWASVFTTRPRVLRTVYIIGTGNPLPAHVADAQFVGTVIDHPVGLVWHVFVEASNA